MKVIAKAIEMVSLTDYKGNINPIKFKFEDKQQQKVVKVEKVICCTEEKQAGIIWRVFKCTSKVNDVDKIYEIRYDTKNCQWLLYKI